MDYSLQHFIYYDKKGYRRDGSSEDYFGKDEHEKDSNNSDKFYKSPGYSSYSGYLEEEQLIQRELNDYSWDLNRSEESGWFYSDYD